MKKFSIVIPALDNRVIIVTTITIINEVIASWKDKA